MAGILYVGDDDPQLGSSATTQGATSQRPNEQPGPAPSQTTQAAGNTMAPEKERKSAEEWAQQREKGYQLSEKERISIFYYFIIKQASHLTEVQCHSADDEDDGDGDDGVDGDDVDDEELLGRFWKKKGLKIQPPSPSYF